MSEQQATDTAAAAAPATAPAASSDPNTSANQVLAGSTSDINMADNAESDAAAFRAQVEREHALADAQKRLKVLEKEVKRVKEEKRGVESERDGAVQATNQLRTQLSVLQSSHHQSNSELTVLQTRMQIVEREKKELYEEAERLQERSTRGNQELHTLRAQKSDTAQKIAHLDVEVAEQRMAAESAKFNEERSKQALEAARTENLRIGKAYTDLDERFGSYRANKNHEFSKLQTDYDILLSRLTTAESSYEALQRSYNDQANRLASAFADISNLTSSAASRKAASQSESYRLADENRVLERRAEEARATIAEREAELERLVGTHEVERRDWDAKWKGEERRRREADKRAEELKAAVDRIALAGGEGTDLSPAATLAGEMRGSGKSYTQFFTEYTVQEGRLRSAENEIMRLTELLDEIGNDIAEKKPLLDEQAAEHAAAIDRANALAAELSTVMTTRDGLQEVLRSMKAAAAHHTEDIAALQSTADDLARQVQNLIRQLAIRDDPSLVNVEINGGAVDETGDIITDHLLEFRSLRGLQENNQRLLKLTRALSARLGEREIRRATAEEEDVDTGATLDQATETIERLHKQLLEANKKINEATRERDFFSKLLARGEGLKWGVGGSSPTSGPLDDEGPAPHQQTIDMLRGEIEGVRVKAEEEVRGLKVELRNKEEAVGSAEVAKARAEAKVQMLEEQSRSLSDANNLQKQRGAGLESQIAQIQASIGSAQNEARMAQEQVALRQAEADRLRMDVAILRAEKEQWASTEARLQSDFRSVQSERTKLQSLIDNYTNVSAESERSRSEERKKLEKRIDELTKETTALRTQIEQIRQATRTAEEKVASADSALEAAVSAVRKEKETAEALAATRQKQITDLEAELEKSRESDMANIRTSNNFKQRWEFRGNEIAAARVKLAEIVAAKDKEIGEIKGKVTDADKSLMETRRKMGEVEKKLADVTRSEALKEGTVQRLQRELTAARSAGASPANGAAMATLQKEKETLQSRVEQLEKDLEAAKAATPAPASGDATAESADLQAKYDEVTKRLEGYDARYEDGVLKVNRINVSLKSRIAALETEKSDAVAKITELEGKIAELEGKITELGNASNAAAIETESVPDEATSGVVDQAKIDEAVQAAVAAKQAELDAALEAAKASAPSAPIGDISSVDNSAAIDAAVKAKEDELKSTIEARVDEALAKQKTELEAEQTKLKGEAAALEAKIKALERQGRTAEMTRKTLERQKDAAETKVKAYEEQAKEEGKALSGDAPAFTPSSTAIPPEAAGLAPVPSGPSNPTPPAGTPIPSSTLVGAAPSIRGNAARGRPAVVRGAARGGGPGRGVLAAVKATLTSTLASAPSPPTAPGSHKRPAPEEGEIADGESGGAASMAQAGGRPDVLADLKQRGTQAKPRQLKRPRGAGPNASPGRGGGAAERRPSEGAGAEETAGGADTPETAEGETSGTADGAGAGGSGAEAGNTE